MSVRVCPWLILHRAFRKIFVLFLLGVFCTALHPAWAADQPPELKREFRGTWVASVYNLDWPSKAGLSSAAQQAELRTILDRAVELKLNAIVLQVRPQCDALYVSKREPWSAFLTGKMGQAPVPFYDPLEFAVMEAHARGLELHAWFNPFRALASSDWPVSADHVSKRHPEWVRHYGKQLWLDPGEAGARDYSREVILDVVRRYDIDGVHIDDYFYPYPIKSASGGNLPFPDGASFPGAVAGRDDWRRANIDGFVSQLYRGIKAEKRWVKFGISPFGIWRPRVPETIEAGLDSYGQLFADSKRWLNEGWCDYFSPQLYWSIAPAKQSFPVLLEWWRGQNLAHRHVWPGIATERIGPGRKAEEIASQVLLTRRDGSPGTLHWSAKSLTRNLGGVSDLLRAGLYSQVALVPASPWLGGGAVEKPVLARAGTRVEWKGSATGEARWWLIQRRRGGAWSSQLVSGGQLNADVGGVDAVAVRGIGRTGAAGEIAVLEVR